MDRRTFLNNSLAMGVVIWSGEKLPKQLEMSEAQVKDLFAVEPANSTALIFPQSVASGDPQPHGITLWTRVVSPQPGLIQAGFEISADPEFKAIATQGVAQTDASKDYTLKVSLNSQSLQPSTTYYYRFIYKGTASRTGRFKTLPAQTTEVNQVRFAYLSCQDYTNGYYNAYPFLAEEEIDFIVFLGDYIYETVGDTSFQAGIRPLPLPSGQPGAVTLEDYRFLYQSYNSDPNLQKLRERFALINIWDDHEFANDCFSANTPYQVPFFNEELRLSANQAWAEYTPTSVPFEAGKDSQASIQIYRTFQFGNLLKLVMTDERLYRDGPPCDNLEAQQQRYLTNKRYSIPDCPERNDPNRTMLGHKQRQWFFNQILNSDCIWKIWGNEVMTMQFKLLSEFATKLLGQQTPDLFLSFDQWDGYPVERTLLFETLKEARVKNFVTISGDLHTFVTGYQKVNFDDPQDEPIGVEFLVGSVTSSNFARSNALDSLKVPLGPIEAITQMLMTSNPHINYFNPTTHGYNLVEVTPEALICTLKAVSTITKPGGTLSILKVFRVPRDQVLIEDITPV
ncbi:alkaline phosphatase D family protein [Brasilonema sp. UFV-L1]|uniref:alkaline phosphatase D family protein n=1 Tax=Brasilonema sp. UFV-L1 TaxID=2234130 RepID=UPI002006E699|nr:alkaline phosphatase D family protein [Brasilonema sp. UFV-L1]